MNSDLLTGFYSMATFILPDLAFLLLGVKKRGFSHKKAFVVWGIIFSFYCYAAIVRFAGIGTVWDLIVYGKLNVSVNLKPFDSVGALTYILNIVMFMPLGFLLPLIWTGYRTPGKVTITGLLMSFTIEILQLFSLRATDIDDLIMNTLGTVAGFLLWKISGKFFTRLSRGWGGITGKDALFLIALGTLGTFLLYNRRLLIYII